MSLERHGYINTDCLHFSISLIYCFALLFLLSYLCCLYRDCCYYYYYLSNSVKSNLTPCIAQIKLNICSCLVSIVLKLYKYLLITLLAT